MNKKDAEKVLASGIQILSDFLPLKNYLYFPILYSACVWAIRRVFDYRERIFSWQVWLEPGAVETKPDDFILHFFESNEELRRSYGEEIQRKDLKSLRRAFLALYPILGLEDAFLQALFAPELGAKDYLKIAAEFKGKVSQVMTDIQPAESHPEFWKALEMFGLQIASLGIHLLSDEKVRRLILDEIRKRHKGTEI